jgi:putative oxygen-independent coproporphyrinogen III oxidase
MSKFVAEKPQAAYLHIPFCTRRCYYCDFPITVVGNGVDTYYSSLMAPYVEIICQEIEITPIYGDSLQTVFFGGGTPSLLSVADLNLILETLDRRLGISPNAEISMEIDPGTFTKEQLQGYHQAGVNRFSLGVQAFQDDLLKICGRSHNSQDIITAIELIHQVGITNFSLDLISGLPTQTLKNWQESLEKAINLQPQHISCYDLVLEPVTAFGKQYHSGIKPLPSDQIASQMYELASHLLKESGYNHYEISNYAKKDYQCQHNRVYWENKPYYGFGMGAASYVNQQRFTRPRTRKDYYKWVQEYQLTGGQLDIPQVSSQDRLLETLMLGFRLAEGININQIKSEFGPEILEIIYTSLTPYFPLGWLEGLDGRGNILTSLEGWNVTPLERLRLKDPQGFLFSNQILAELFHNLESEDM